jgi:hypothetical protein
MIKKALLVLVALLAIVLVIAAFKSPHFRVERSRSIPAGAEALFPFVNNHKKFNEINPWLKMDPAAKVSYAGPESGVGAVSSWEGGKTGKGSATIIESKPNELVKLRMDWKEPMEGTNTVEYTLVPDGAKTKLTWAMYGDSNYMGRLMSLIMDCEKMCGPPFEQGLADIEKAVTAKP